MSFSKWIFLSISIPMTGLAIAVGSNIKSLAVRAPDGTVAFEAGLLLVNTSTTFNGVRVRQAKYYFDLELPADIGEPLQKVVIQQRKGGDEVEFKPEKTQVYLGDRRNKGERIGAIAKVNNSASENKTAAEIIIQFKRSISPGNKITIGLKPKQNPKYPGVYLFGVTAFPRGEKARGMYLGAGRLHFYRNDGARF